MTAPRLAVALVHYRAEGLLARCLAALRGSTLADFRAVVVDNGSSRPLGPALADDPRLELVTAGRNLGYAAGINLALQNLPRDTPYVLLLNPDVLVDEGTIAATLAALEERPGVGAATCKLLLPSGRIDPACRRAEPTPWTALAKQLGLQRLFPRSPRVGRYNLAHLDPSVPHAIDAASGAFLLLRRAALEQVGGRLDERFFLYGEDLDLCRRLRETGWSLLYWPHARALHVKGSGRIRSARTTAHFYRAMWIYYRKWGERRRHPLVLGPLAVALVLLGTTELLRHELARGWQRLRRYGRAAR
jgi:N-acetylglucosaminyl-diphospho-decaprenol L-rhamnosyltransferase